MIAALVLFPLIAGLVLLVTKNYKARGIIIRISAITTIVLTAIVVCNYFTGKTFNLSNFEWINYILMVTEVLLALYIIYVGIKHKKYLASILTLIQTPAVLIFELTKGKEIEVTKSLLIDKLTIIMIAIVGVIGSLICIYAVGYMREYHKHHTEFKDRRQLFFFILFVFLSAMFGLVLSNNLLWLYFCWEVTTLCSFILIGYTRTKEATDNSFRALILNLLGGVAFAAAIIFFGLQFNTVEITTILNIPRSNMLLIPVFLIGFAGLTKSAQMPFSSWLLGAMVAPTPTSALLHSSTMVKAGVYIIIRFSGLFSGNFAGVAISLVGGITFLAAAFMAISQSDAKKILAYSTISNLGLIVACAAIGTKEAVWASIMLIIFHAISKSLLFLSVGSTEHQIGSRNVEDMDGLIAVSKTLSAFMIIGIAGMFLAPFGMLISKWAAMKAFIDSKNIILILIVCFGSSATLFFWAKWLGKLIANVHRTDIKTHRMTFDERIPLYIQAGLTVLACLFFPVISSQVVVKYLGQSSFSPLTRSDVTIMILMLCMLILLFITFSPLYKNRSNSTLYLAGNNTENGIGFYGSMGKVYQPQFRNWYMKDWFGEDKLTGYANWLAIGTLIIGAAALIVIGGLL